MSDDETLLSRLKEFLIDRNIAFDLNEVEWSEFREHENEKYIMKVKLRGKLGTYTFYIKECESLKILTCRNASDDWYGYKSDMHAWIHFYEIVRQHVSLRRYLNNIKGDKK